VSLHTIELIVRWYIKMLDVVVRNGLIFSRNLFSASKFTLLIMLLFVYATVNASETYTKKKPSSNVTNSSFYNKQLLVNTDGSISASLLQDFSSPRELSIQQLLTQAVGLPDQKKVSLINTYFNTFKNKTDMELWGLVEYWATPSELFSQNAGDCEDIAVAKYIYLSKLGINDKNLRLAFVKAFNKDTLSIENHLVLLFHSNQLKQEFVLDNIEREILSVRARKDLNYQFAFNKISRWSLNKSISDSQIKHSGIYKSWESILHRLD